MSVYLDHAATTPMHPAAIAAYAEALGTVGPKFGPTELPTWARPLGFPDYFGIRHRRFRGQLEAMMADAGDRVIVNRRTGELTIGFGDDTNQAAQFARSVPDFVLKGRFADQVRLDLKALEQEMEFSVGRPPSWWQRMMRGHVGKWTRREGGG